MQKFAITYSYRASVGASLQPIVHYIETDGLAQATRAAADSLVAEQIVPVNLDGTNGVAILSDNVQALKVAPLIQRNIAAETGAIQKKIRQYDPSPTSRRRSF